MMTRSGLRAAVPALVPAAAAGLLGGAALPGRQAPRAMNILAQAARS
ncbi:hypothetical protein ACIQ6Y_11600 [Streptomyces sp. NPDC096205]